MGFMTTIHAYTNDQVILDVSHKKGIVKKANWLDLPMRYAPYKDKLQSIKKLLQWL